MVQPEAKGILAPPKYSRLWRASQSLVDFADPYKVIYLKTDISVIDRIGRLSWRFVYVG